MSNIEWILIIITIFLVILLFRYIQLKKQIRNLADQVNELNSGNSQQMLDISLIDKDLERLAGILNQYNIRQRQAVAGVLRNEEYLKESVANISHDLRTPLTVTHWIFNGKYNIIIFFLHKCYFYRSNRILNCICQQIL